MQDIDRLSRKGALPVQVAPNTPEIPSGRRTRGGVSSASWANWRAAACCTADVDRARRPWAKALAQWDIKTRPAGRAEVTFTAPAPGGVRHHHRLPVRACRYPTLDDDRAEGAFATRRNAYSQDGGLAVLYGNIAERGCIVKTAGVDDSILKFTGRARFRESFQDAQWKAFSPTDRLGRRHRHHSLRRPEGRPGHAGNAHPTSYLKSKGLGKDGAHC